MGRVSLDTKAFNDFRFKIMAGQLAIHRDHAMALMTRAWAYCLDNETYLISPEIFDLVCEHPGAFEAARHARLIRDEKEEEGWYVCGTRGRIEWVGKLRKAAKKGGAATKKLWRQAPTEASQVEPQGTPQGPTEPGPKPGPISSSSASASASASSLNTNTEVLECKATWRETLRLFGSERNLTSREEILIYMALKKDSSELINQALSGARYEPIVKDFNPARAPDIARILGDLDRPKGRPSQIAKFAGYEPRRVTAEEEDPYARA